MKRLFTVSSAIAAGSLPAGANLLASGQVMPARSSSVNGSSFNWSRIVFLGGNRVLSGDALFTKYQPIWDPRITWASGRVRLRQPAYWGATLFTPGNTFVKSFTDTVPANQSLVTAGVVNATSLTGATSLAGRTGLQGPQGALSTQLIS